MSLACLPLKRELSALARGLCQRFGNAGAMELTDQCGGFGGGHHAGDDAGPADKHHVDVGFGRRQLGAELGDEFADGIEIDGFAIDETFDELFVGHIYRSLIDLTDAVIAVRHFAGKTPARGGAGFSISRQNSGGIRVQQNMKIP
jgi:hypothetical protein